MLLSKIIDIIINAGAALGLFFSMALISSRNKRQRANIILSALLIGLK